MVRVDGVVFFQILDAAKAAYEITDLQRAIINLTMTNLRTVMGSMDLDDLLSQRDRINTQLLHVVDEATTPWGVKVTRIEIKDIAPPTDLVDSMARQMKAERDKRAAILEAEGDRQAQILKSEGEKQAAILQAAKAAYEISGLEIAILNLTMTNLRTVMGSMDLDELLSQRDRINTQLLHTVDDATTPWGVKVTRIEIKDIAPPTDLVDSMARQMKAERDKRASILEAEGLRQAAILKAEGEKQSAILESEGRKEAAFRDAEARERAAEAEAKATAMLSQALARGDRQAINYFVAQKYVEAFGKFATAPNQKVIFLPLEATSLLGSLGGIGEIAREAMGKSSGAANGAGDP
jgi:regulator of protease activity HflC (stomatin/prohibitin superfamily)